MNNAGVLSLSLLVILGGGCGEEASAPNDSDPSCDRSAADAPAVVEASDERPALALEGQTLPVVDHDLARLPGDAPQIFVTRSAVVVGGNEIAKIADGRFAEAAVKGQLVLPIFDALEPIVHEAKRTAEQAGAVWDEPLVVIADDRLDYDLLVDTLYTARLAGFRRFALVGQTDEARPGVVPLRLEKIGARRPGPDDSDVIVSLEDNQVRHRGPTMTTPVVTPNKEGRFDITGVLGPDGATETTAERGRVRVYAQGTRPLRDVVPALAAICRYGGSDAACGYDTIVVHAGRPSFSIVVRPWGAEIPSIVTTSAAPDYGRGAGASFGGRGTRKPKVRMAKPTISGNLDRDLLRRVVRAHIDELRSCYNAALSRNPNLTGRVTIDFTVNADGKVDTADVASSTVRDEAVGNCMAKATQRWTFAKPHDGKPGAVTYPFVLTPR